MASSEIKVWDRLPCPSCGSEIQRTELTVYGPIRCRSCDKYVGFARKYKTQAKYLSAGLTILLVGALRASGVQWVSMILLFPVIFIGSIFVVVYMQVNLGKPRLEQQENEKFSSGPLGLG
jgi:hypothetical protein